MDPAELVEFAKKITNTYYPSAHDREDVAQEVALALWKAQERYNPEKSQLHTYLWKVGHWAIQDYGRKQHANFCLSNNRSERHYIQKVELDEEWQGGELDKDMGYGEDVIEAFNRETPRNRRILFEHFVEDRTTKDIGEEYGISESRICQIVVRFRERFSVRDTLLVRGNWKCSPVQQTAIRCLSQPKGFFLRPKPSRRIVNTSFLNSVQETLPTQSQSDSYLGCSK